MIRFYLDYIAQWPTVLGIGLPVLIWAGWAGRRLALRILRDKESER
jgi:hypothetical protein